METAVKLGIVIKENKKPILNDRMGNCYEKE